MTRPAFTRRWFVGAALLALAGCAPRASVPAPAAEPATTVFVVRHAERAGDPAGDPGLTPAGQSRAEALPQAVRDAGRVAAIYSTQLRRTQATAAPLAAAMGIAVTTRPASAANSATYAQDLAREILSRHAGQTVVVVGHSNTVPAIVAALSGGPAPALTEADYGDLFRVVIPRTGAPRVERGRFGP